MFSLFLRPYSGDEVKIIYNKGDHPNFGDDLNLWLWPKLLPNFFDDKSDVLFLGIGSIISDDFDPTAKKIIFGAGFVSEYYTKSTKPNVGGENWDIFFVRGPHTAKALHIHKDLAIGDSAILSRILIDTKCRTPTKISFMPHWESLSIGNWEEVCQIAGINLIDPRLPVETVLREILNSKVIITEAMHGAIIADALRIPWIPVLPINSIHRAKWHDWADSLSIDLHPYRMWPSTLEEANHALTHRPILSTFKRSIDTVSILSSLANAATSHIAAYRLKQLSHRTPVLSSDQVLGSILVAMEKKLEQLKRKYS